MSVLSYMSLSVITYVVTTFDGGDYYINLCKTGLIFNTQHYYNNSKIIHRKVATTRTRNKK